MKITEIIAGVLILANTVAAIWMERRSSKASEEYQQDLREIRVEALQLRNTADSVVAVQWSRIEALRIQRSRDSAEYQSMKIKLNEQINDLSITIEDYRRRLVDVGDLPIY